jgi:hypothetical protein
MNREPPSNRTLKNGWQDLRSRPRTWALRPIGSGQVRSVEGEEHAVVEELGSA